MKYEKKFYRIEYIVNFTLYRLWYGEITDTASTNDIEIQTKQSLMDESQKKIFLEVSIQNNYTDGVVTKLSDISLDLKRLYHL